VIWFHKEKKGYRDLCKLLLEFVRLKNRLLAGWFGTEILQSSSLRYHKSTPHDDCRKPETSEEIL